MEGSKYEVGQLVACFYKTIPPTPQWNPFIEGRPSIITRIKKSVGIKETRYYYELQVTRLGCSFESRLVSEENIVPYENLGELDQEIEDMLIQYYKKNPLATD